MEERKVVSTLSRVNPSKTDRLKGRVLRNVITQLFQQLLDSSFVPHMWKESTIIPVTKKGQDWKWLQAHSVICAICKCMERVVCDHLSTLVADTLQFTLLDTVTSSHSYTGFY